MIALLLLSFPLPLVQDEPNEAAVSLTHGPFLGHIGQGEANIWARASHEGKLALHVTPEDREGKSWVTDEIASTENDLCVTWHVERLRPESSYTFVVTNEAKDELARGRFVTLASADAPQKITLALGSCVNEKRFPEQPAWAVMRRLGAQAVVLLGDTPYIDTTNLAVQRRRYREFYAVEEIAKLWKEVPFYCTWDDHDFGSNDTDGNLEGRENSRRAFREYHANPSYGENDEGIYTRFRRGPIEIFLLDARWFAGTEPSPVAPEEKTLLGKAQWAWLKKRLAASTATFKLLATGMIWNGATRPGKTDHWMAYPHERQAVFDYIGEAKIPGVVLIGGDIHRWRALRYPTTESAGYELTELITSPIANTVIVTANAPSPHLLWDGGLPDTFLLLNVDSTIENPTLHAQFLDSKGEVHYELTLDAHSLRRAR